MNPLKRVNETRAPAPVLLIRLMVGTVFLTEGVQKFLFPADLGVGRFTKIGIPFPETMAPFVAVFEIGRRPMVSGCVLDGGGPQIFASYPGPANKVTQVPAIQNRELDPARLLTGGEIAGLMRSGRVNMGFGLL